MFKRLILLSALITAAAGTINAQQLSYTFNETLRLGNVEGFDVNYIFGIPNHIAVDEEGHVFISDRQQRFIKMFDKEGIFVRQVGERGRGPGEFIDISSMYIDPSQNHLVVVDRMNLRTTRFDLDGEYVQTHTLPKGPVISPWMGRADEDGNHYLLYRIPVMPGQPAPSQDHLVHVYNDDFSKVTESLVEVSHFGDLDNPVIDGTIGGPNTGLFKLISKNRIVGAPYLYDGMIFLYEKNNTEWIMDTELKGKQPLGEVIKVVDSNNPPENASRMGTPRGTFSFLRLSATIGLHLVDENTLAHYVHFQDENYENGEVGVSLFDLSDGRFLGYTRIEEFSHDKSSGWDVQIKYSRGNTIYFVDNRYDEPNIVAAEIEFSLE